MAAPRHSHWQNDPTILQAANNAPALRQGASGRGVQRLREALLVMGAPALAEPADQFGPLTRAQVSAFQTLYTLSTDGVAGSGTIGKLDDLLTTPARRKAWPTHAANGSKETFLRDVARECGPIVKANGLPVSAMLACAAVESGWGTGPIFKQTGNLFSLQKWPWVPFPTTGGTLWRTTVIQTHPVKTAKAPFNTAADLADAGRQWCEWILHYGAADGPQGNPNQRGPMTANAHAIGRRMQLLKLVGDPVQFATHLHLVSFGESQAHGQTYGRVLKENDLTRFD